MATAQQTAEVLALVQAQAQAREQLVDITSAAVVAQVSAFSGWYDAAQITKLAGLLAKVTRAAQKRTAASTDAYAVRVLRLLGQKARARGPVASETIRSVPLESVYGRLADQYRYHEATRGPNAPAEALQRRNDAGILIDPFPRLTREQVKARVVTRARVQVEDNLSLAVTRQWAEVLSDDDLTEVVGYRRILHPELSRGGSCGLCVAASDRLYRKAELMPLHARCACDVMPVLGDPYSDDRVDPGAAINAADLKRLYAEAGSTAAADLKKTRWKVAQHSELGPRLVAAGDRVRTAAQAERDAA